MVSGEEKAWELLASLPPEEVCRNTQAAYDAEEGAYILVSCGMEVRIAPKERKICSNAPGSDLLLQRMSYFFKLSALWYLCSAKDIALSGRLVSPVNLKGGQLYFRGSHVLPNDKVAQKYGTDAAGFIARGKELGGEVLEHGDAAVRLFPLPRVPVVLILWTQDEEFPPRMDLLLDSTCEMQLPLDIVWSIAMMSLLIML
ncbi:MAG: DUF3786 domain-containing protein [Alphaproteobacteria bacterium]|uniref:DUF3786 domain-containing protein n=1 Tax=Candidatus Nitrobium versatile TaxID=2884831 RepID=A0A953M389_9BACT|nr:DUF3786 domain-containing protein [Candidatus Nitrobium versatile]